MMRPLPPEKLPVLSVLGEQPFKRSRIISIEKQTVKLIVDQIDQFSEAS